MTQTCPLCGEEEIPHLPYHIENEHSDFSSNRDP